MEREQPSFTQFVANSFSRNYRTEKSSVSLYIPQSIFILRENKPSDTDAWISTTDPYESNLPSVRQVVTRLRHW
jgi:hypothetical protein